VIPLFYSVNDRTSVRREFLCSRAVGSHSESPREHASTHGDDPRSPLLPLGRPVPVTAPDPLSDPRASLLGTRSHGIALPGGLSLRVSSGSVRGDASMGRLLLRTGDFLFLR
jgi:hypothetical protein